MRGQRSSNAGTPSERRQGFSFLNQARVLVPLLGVWVAGLLLLGAVAYQTNAPELLLDPNHIAGAPWYFGFISQLGAVAWTVAATSAAWAAWISRLGGRRGAARFLLMGAMATVVLLLDDLFEFHATVPAQLGLPKLVGEAAVVVPVAAWLVLFRSDVVRTRVQLLSAALGALAASFAVDIAFAPASSDLSVLLEDGPKFLGILGWATYFVMTTHDIARSVMRVTFEHAVGSGGSPGHVTGGGEREPALSGHR